MRDGDETFCDEHLRRDLCEQIRRSNAEVVAEKRARAEKNTRENVPNSGPPAEAPNRMPASAPVGTLSDPRLDPHARTKAQPRGEPYAGNGGLYSQGTDCREYKEATGEEAPGAFDAETLFGIGRSSLYGVDARPKLNHWQILGIPEPPKRLE